MTKTCCVKGCDRPHLARGFCSMHYYRLNRGGDVGDAKSLKQRGRKCSVPGCNNRHQAHGYCAKHNHRLRVYGDVNKAAVIVGDDERRFWQKVDKNGPTPENRPELGPCWLWTGYLTPDGYGRFWLDGKNAVASRYSYELNVGPIPDGEQPDHLCRNRACVNPSHLEPVSVRVNLLRGEGGGCEECSQDALQTRASI